MKGYILKRLLRSLLSILVIITAVFIMVYSLVSRDNIFKNDDTFRKLSAKPDDKTDYIMRTWQNIGYLDYQNMSYYCTGLYGEATDETRACVLAGSKESKEFVDLYESKGYTIKYFINGAPYAYKDLPVISRLASWFGNMIQIDHPWKVKDETNPDLERRLYVGTTPTGGVALKCSGCEYKYQIYTDSRFPFIHQNILTVYLGESYPTYKGLKILDVIFDTQGQEVKKTVTFETGQTGESSIMFGTCRYKSVLDRLDQNKFTDHYASCMYKKATPSMVGISFIMGIFSIIIAYALGLPIGLAMARNKDKLIDKLGMVYIIFIIAVPSLAYIYIFRYLGTTLFGLPSAFPTLGAEDIRSWILPVISLALPSISGLMLWMRRYAVDQMSSDYVKFAKSKGLNQHEIFKNHILKNAIIPIAQGIPASLASCIVGAIITEAIYSVGGMGKMLPDAIKQYNNAMVLALTFMFAGISIISVLLGDLILIWLDPRISLTEKEGRN